MTSYKVQTQAAALLDSKPEKDGIPFVTSIRVSLKFYLLLIRCVIGHWSRHPKLSKPAVPF